MKKIINELAGVALLVFVVSFTILVVSLFAGFYDNMVWSMVTSFIAWCFILPAIGIPDNDAYLKALQRRRQRQRR